MRYLDIFHKMVSFFNFAQISIDQLKKIKRHVKHHSSSITCMWFTWNPIRYLTRMRRKIDVRKNENKERTNGFVRSVLTKVIPKFDLNFPIVCVRLFSFGAITLYVLFIFFGMDFISCPGKRILSVIEHRCKYNRIFWFYWGRFLPMAVSIPKRTVLSSLNWIWAESIPSHGKWCTAFTRRWKTKWILAHVN